MSTFELRPYQVEGVEFLQRTKRAMLLDWPGLGKTAQAAFAAKTPAIIFCPNYLVEQWRDWLAGEDAESLRRNKDKVIPNVSGTIVAARGTRDERIAALDSNADWLVCNHEMLTNYDHFDVEKDKKWHRRWRTVIIDESHHLKAHNGKRARNAVKFCKRAEFVYLLTATPVKREIDDFFMQFRILQPDLFSSYWRFVNTFCVTEQSYFGTQILGAKRSMLPELQRVLGIISLGRSYKDAGRDLPPMLPPKYVPIELNPELKRIYKEAIDFWRIEDEAGRLNFTNYMQVMHTLRQHFTGGLKTEVVKGIIEDSVAKDHKSVIFSWYQNTAETIGAAVENCNVVHGKLEASERRKLAMNGKNVSATIASLSEGIDLSSARNVIFVETDWTPGSNYQALSRIRRERLTEDNAEPVVVYYVYVKGTIDEVVLRTSEGRARTVKEIVKESLYI